MSKVLLLQVNIPTVSEKKLHGLVYSKEIYEKSHENNSAYAKRIGADYFQITDDRYYPNTHPVWQKCAVFHKDFSEYDTIIYADSDFMFHSESPNILEVIANRKEGFFIGLESEDIKPFTIYKGRGQENRFNVNSGLFIIRRDLINELGDSWKWYWEEHINKRRVNKFHDQDAIRDIVHELISEKTAYLSRHWNGTWAIKFPLFATHYCALRKRNYTPDYHKKIEEWKKRKLSELSNEDINNLHFYKHGLTD